MGKEIPLFIQTVALNIKNAYPFCALFMIGLGAAQQKLSGGTGPGVAVMLVIGKVFISPVVFYWIVVMCYFYFCVFFLAFFCWNFNCEFA